jgi:hypothetical protein
MLATATHPNPYPTAGLLTARAIARKLSRQRLPSYRALAETLDDLIGFRLRVSELWRGVFDQPMPTGDTLNAFIMFAQRVDSELFPVHLGALDDWLYNVEEWKELVYHPIPYFGYGVPWEVESLGGIPEWARPMIATTWVAEQCNYDDCIVNYWETLGYDEIPTLTWSTDSERATAMLKQLPPPLDGLAGAYHTVCKDVDNLFLVIPSPFYTYEYYWDDSEWDVACVKWLAEMYATAKDDIEALERYIDWFGLTLGSEKKVVEILVGLEDKTDAMSDSDLGSGKRLIEVLGNLEDETDDTNHAE